MTHSEAIDELNKTVGGWFGSADKIFSGHPMEVEQAKKARKLASNSGVTLDEIVQIAEQYFDRENLGAELRKKNMARILKTFGTKLK